MQLMEIPEVPSSHLALVPTVLVLTVSEDQIFLSHLEMQLVSRIRALIFNLLSFLNR